MKRLLLVILVVINPLVILAQMMNGLTTGNYAGVNSIIVNPSALHNSRTYMEIQLLGADFFVQNNYLYIPRSEYKFTNFFRSAYSWPVYTDEYSGEQRALHYYNNKKLKNAFFQTRIMGPGAMLLAGKHAFAVTTSARTMVNARQVPYELANFSWIGLKYPPQQNILYHDQKPMRVNGLAWAELGLSYANAFYARGFDHFSAGVTLKSLWGFSGFYFYTNDLMYVVPNDTTIDIRNINAEMGLALPVNYQTNEPELDKLFKGHGFAFDVGVTYKKLLHYHQEQYYNSLCEQPFEDYYYRIGIALIDIGMIKFRNNAVKMNLDNRSAFWNDIDNLRFSNINHFLDTLSFKFYGDTISAYTGNQFSIWLPSALSVQFDYHLRPRWYINSNLIYGFPIAKGALTRPSELTITPRYETSRFEFSVPIGLYDWRQPRLGVALRFYGLTIGTDKLGGFLSFADFTGMDFYFSLKISFNKGDCRIKGPVHCGSETEKYRTNQH